MTLKQFKTRFKKSQSIIESELNKISNYAEELDDEILAEMIQEITNNVYITIIENTTERPSSVTFASYQDYLDELEEMAADDEDLTDDEY